MNKLNKRAISILVIATFLLSMIPIMPASAAVTIVTVTGTSAWTPSGYAATFFTPGGATAGWTTEQALELTSVKLATGSTGRGQLKFVLTTPIALSTMVSQPSFMYYDASVNASGQWNMTGPLVQSEVPWGTPYVNIGFNQDGGSSTDAWLEGVGSSEDGDTVGNALGTEAVLPSDSTWTEMSEGWGYYTENAKFSGLSGIGEEFFNVSTFAQWKTAILAAHPNADVTEITINFGYWQAQYMPQGPVYVDNININGTVYPLEATATQSADKGDTLTISGTGLTSGALVSAYWDFATGPNVHLLNTTLGNPDGSFDIEVDVPSDLVGDHYLWITDIETGIPVKYGTPIFVVPKLTAKPDSGLVGDEITVTGYGFSDEVDVTIDFNGDVQTTSIETSELGYFTYKFDVPTGTTFDDYDITAVDDNGWTGVDEYTVGASFTMTPDEGPTGTIISVEGRGWSKGGTVTFAIPSGDLETLDGEDIITESDGTFEAELVMPGVSSTGEYTITATESNSTSPQNTDSDKFEVDGLPKIKLSPGYGPPGQTVTVTGYNFTQDSGAEVTLDFGTVTGLETYDLDGNGEFTGTFTAQALQSSPPDWEVLATDDFGLNDDAMFRLGMMIIIVSPTSGPSGDLVYLTGTGFEPDGDWNATLDGELIAEDIATGAGVIADYFYVPSMEAGTYNIEVLDIESEISLSIIFTTTEDTYVTVSPGQAPVEYNVTIEGFNFANTAGLVDFELYNSTDEWTLEALFEGSDVQTTAYGNFTAWFLVPDDVSNGDYLINVTGSEDLFDQIAFSVVSARVDVAPRKATFDRGDTVSFTILNDFVLDDSYIEIYSPDETLWWITEDFATDVWILNDDDLYTVPNYLQTANLNQMELASDAPMGTWIYFFYDKTDDELMNGTFVVGPSVGAQVDEMLDDVRDDIAALAGDLAGITDDVEDSVAALSDEIAGVAGDLSNLADDIVSDLAGDIADATDAGNAALNAVEDLANSMNDLGDAVSDIADIASDSAEASQSAADAANDAVSAAEEAQKSASGLTTLVYGAIGASLIAALAAIVSLMQISKRIAG